MWQTVVFFLVGFWISNGAEEEANTEVFLVDG